MVIADGTRLINPDIGAMREHLEHLFGGSYAQAHYGEIELAWTDPVPDDDGRHALRFATRFTTDELEELAEEAARLNLTPMCNVYVGAALRRPHFPGDGPVGRASDADFLCLTCAYADLDEPDATAQAKDKYRTAKPTLVVVTGHTPHTRAQLWWRLDEPIQNPVESRALLEGIAAALGGDTSVVNPSRVMRLAGSIAWPMKPDRVVEMTHFGFLKAPGQPEYAPAHMQRVFHLTEQPRFYAKGNGPLNGGNYRAIRTEGEFPRNKDVFGHDAEVYDRRELYMRNTIEAVLIELVATDGACPAAKELFDAAWPQYERKVDLTRPGPGPKRDKPEFFKKCIYTVKRFLEKRIPGLSDVDAAIEAYYYKQDQPFNRDTDFPAPDPTVNLILSSAEFTALRTTPSYIVDGIIQRGYIYSLTARTHHGKTAVAMYIAQCVARGEDMHRRKVKSGTVLILAGENPDDVMSRFMVLASHYKFDVNTVKIKWISGVKHLPSHIDKIRAEVELIDDLILVIVDTAAAYYYGEETNSNAEQGEYARRLRQLTFLKGKPAVIVNCHPVKNALRENLLPMGGSAFVNEVDGNLTLWANSDKQTTLHWHGKFRGPEFDPMSFELVTDTSEEVKDEEGRLMPSVVAEPISEQTVEAVEEKQESEENRVMKAMAKHAGASLSQIAMNIGMTKMGEPEKYRVHRIMERLRDDKMVEKHRRRYRLTDKGKKEIGIKVVKEEDFP